LVELSKVLATGPHFAETFAAIDGSTLTGFERYFRVFAAFSTNRRVHLAGFAAARAHPFGFPCLPAGGTPFWFVGVTLRLEELLFRSGEGKGITTIGTLECFILKRHG
jgi:hypothetical protein